jgi:hypothetical protein
MTLDWMIDNTNYMTGPDIALVYFWFAMTAAWFYKGQLSKRLRWPNLFAQAIIATMFLAHPLQILAGALLVGIIVILTAMMASDKANQIKRKEESHV